MNEDKAAKEKYEAEKKKAGPAPALTADCSKYLLCTNAPGPESGFCGNQSPHEQPHWYCAD